MKKKINCKHGLDVKQEIAARKIRQKLEQKDEETLNEYRKLFAEYIKEPRDIPYVVFLEEKNIVYYSAMLRIMGVNDRSSIFCDIFTIKYIEKH